eukprot:334138_1
MSTEPKRNSKWNKLLSFPFLRFSEPFVINNDEFMVVSSREYGRRDGLICSGAGDGIYKFNTQKNKWTKIFDYDNNFKCSAYSAAYDYKHKLLYICDTSEYPSSRMLTFDVKTRKKVTSKKEEREDEYGFRLIFVEDKLHKISIRNGDHYIYDKTKQFQKK